MQWKDLALGFTPDVAGGRNPCLHGEWRQQVGRRSGESGRAAFRAVWAASGTKETEDPKIATKTVQATQHPILECCWTVVSRVLFGTLEPPGPLASFVSETRLSCGMVPVVLQTDVAPPSLTVWDVNARTSRLNDSF